MNSDKNDMVNIPLPLEIPPPPSLENLPLDILHSATVEMLIQQNEDLSSRLKVNIRRNSQFEQKILELEAESKDLSRKQQNMLSQFEIICEKEKIWLGQKENKARQTESLEKEISLLNLRYNELYTTSQQLQKKIQQDLVDKNKALQESATKNKVLLKIKTRSKEKLRYFLLDMAQKFQTLESELTRSQSSNRVLVNKFESLQEEIATKENFFKEQFESFKKVSLQSYEALQLKNEKLLLNQESFQKNLEESKRELKVTQEDFFQEKKGRLKIKQLSEEINLLKNDKIRLRTEFDKKTTSLEQNSQSLAEKNIELKSHIQQLQTELSEQKILTVTCEEKMLDLIKDNKELSSQLETIQTLWINAQEKLEKEELKRQGLERINRELSQTYNDKRLERAIDSVNTTDEPIYSYRNISPKAEMDL